MAEQFYTILTNVGKAKIANALPTGTKVNLTKMKIGDSNGTYYNPSESQTELVHKVYECNVTSVEVDESNPNWITITAAIPSDVGGFSIREVGVFDDSNSLIAIGKYPETYKPVASDGSVKELYIKMTLEVVNASSVELKIDPTIILATKKDVENINTKVEDVTSQLEHIEYYITPQMFGAKGDGVTDDTNAIKFMLSESKNKNILFPDGEYIISEQIITKADNDKNVSITLSDYCVIKANDAFVGDTMFHIGGEVENSYKHFGKFHSHSLRGFGTIDCNSITSGVDFSNCANTKFENITILNCKDFGYRINYGSNSGSMDTTSDNIQIIGTKTENSIGVIVESYDNLFNNIRVKNCDIGFQINKGGNYFTNCHPLGGEFSNKERYEKQIAFNIGECGDNTFLNCYSDNFSIGWNISKSAWKNVISNPYFYWWKSDEFNHICFNTPNEQFNQLITNPQISFPAQGNNYILKAPMSVNLEVIKAVKGKIKNIMLSGTAYSRLKEPFGDTAFMGGIVEKDFYVNRYSSTWVKNDKYYPIAELMWSRDSHNRINIDFLGEDALTFNATFSFSSKSFNMNECRSLNNYTGGNISLALGNYRTSYDGYNQATLYIKLTKCTTTFFAFSVKAITSPCCDVLILPQEAYRTVTGYSELDTITNQISSSINLNSNSLVNNLTTEQLKTLKAKLNALP